MNGATGKSPRWKDPWRKMLIKRVLVAVILLPIGLIFIYLGGWPFAVLIALILGLASREYAILFRAGGYEPAGFLMIGASVLFALGRAYNNFISEPWLVSLFVLSALTYHLVAYERGRDLAATDFSITLAGGMYIGWIGSYLVSLRALDDGMWWLLLALPAVWLADTGAYFIGRQWGKHKMSKRLSPKKSWEGYIGGIVFGVLGTMLLAWLFQRYAPVGPMINIWSGALLGLVLSLVSVLGDLGESMIKRQVGMKDSGTLLPGHGGVFDRIDSWLWGGVVGYFLVLLITG